MLKLIFTLIMSSVILLSKLFLLYVAIKRTHYILNVYMKLELHVTYSEWIVIMYYNLRKACNFILTFELVEYFLFIVLYCNKQLTK